MANLAFFIPISILRMPDIASLLITMYADDERCRCRR
jgi:hypothetical protein